MSTPVGSVELYSLVGRSWRKDGKVRHVCAVLPGLWGGVVYWYANIHRMANNWSTLKEFESWLEGAEEMKPESVR